MRPVAPVSPRVPATLLLAFALVGCTAGPFPPPGPLSPSAPAAPSADVSAPAQAAAPFRLRGRVAIDAPLVGASIQALDLAGAPLALPPIETGPNGTFAVDAPALAGRDFRLVASGGRLAGAAFTGRLEAVRGRDEAARVVAYLTPTTTLASRYQAARGLPPVEAERAVLGYLGLPGWLHLGAALDTPADKAFDATAAAADVVGWAEGLVGAVGRGERWPRAATYALLADAPGAAPFGLDDLVAQADRRPGREVLGDRLAQLGAALEAVAELPPSGPSQPGPARTAVMAPLRNAIVDLDLFSAVVVDVAAEADEVRHPVDTPQRPLRAPCLDVHRASWDADFATAQRTWDVAEAPMATDMKAVLDAWAGFVFLVDHNDRLTRADLDDYAAAWPEAELGARLARLEAAAVATTGQFESASTGPGTLPGPDGLPAIDQLNAGRVALPADSPAARWYHLAAMGAMRTARYPYAIAAREVRATTNFARRTAMIRLLGTQLQERTATLRDPAGSATARAALWQAYDAAAASRQGWAWPAKLTANDLVDTVYAPATGLLWRRRPVVGTVPAFTDGVVAFDAGRYTPAREAWASPVLGWTYPTAAQAALLGPTPEERTPQALERLGFAFGSTAVSALWTQDTRDGLPIALRIAGLDLDPDLEVLPGPRAHAPTLAPLMVRSGTAPATQADRLGTTAFTSYAGYWQAPVPRRR